MILDDLYLMLLQNQSLRHLKSFSTFPKFMMLWKRFEDKYPEIEWKGKKAHKFPPNDVDLENFSP